MDAEMIDKGNITYKGLLEAYRSDLAPPDCAFFRKEDGLVVMSLIHPEMSEAEAQKFIDDHTDENGWVILT